MPDENAGPTKIRHVRISETLWSAAATKAKGEGRGLAEVIRELLSAYVRG